MRPALRRSGLVVGLVALLTWVLQGTGPVTQPAVFAAEVARLSEPEGVFDTDNLISNEGSYLDALPALKGSRGGAYIGVGPDQNFTYIARVRPSVAYILDIRRDNLLLHLLFKALFAESRTRAEYLGLLTGRPVPAGMGAASIDEIVRQIDASTPSPPDAVAALRARLDEVVVSFGVPLSSADLDTIGRFHRTFIAAGLDLIFTSHGQPRRAYYPGSRYPSFRKLLTAADPHGRQSNYLAVEGDFQYLKMLQARDAIVPVVGDVSGAHALKAIAGDIDSRRRRLTAFYISNVEFYLTRDRSLARFFDNLSQVPRDDDSVMIRSVFGGGSSRTVVQPIAELLAEAAAGRR
jgi:hypothetical protein